MVTTKLTTAAELIAMPDDGYRYELIDGRLHRMSPAGFDHGTIGMEFARHLGNHVVPRRLGLVANADTGFILGRDPDVVLAPDASFLRTDRLPPPSERGGYIEVAPDLVAEVVSPHDRQPEVDAKVARYLAAGVRRVFVVYPSSRQVVVHAPHQSPVVLGEGETIDGGDVLPDFRLPVAALFSMGG